MVYFYNPVFFNFEKASTPMRYLNNSLHTRLRPARKEIKEEWLLQVFGNPEFEEI
jgi:hypothetical protein